ncbi:MAG: class I SAM-dependent methyltransferase [Candidatus Bathyarchaeia archaeon]
MAGWKDKRRVMQRYDLTAEMYEERYAEEQKAKYKAALEKEDVTDGMVLDVGCGSGLFFREVTAQSGMIIGVDISRKLLLKAKKQADSLTNVSVLQADADHLPFKNAFFDVVFAFTVLQNMPKPVETLKELNRVVKPNGKVVVTGLKKAFSLNIFMDALEGSGMKIISFVDNEDLKCYVATLAASAN